MFKILFNIWNSYLNVLKVTHGTQSILRIYNVIEKVCLVSDMTTLKYYTRNILKLNIRCSCIFILFVKVYACVRVYVTYEAEKHTIINVNLWCRWRHLPSNIKIISQNV